jgi:polyphosphate kinase
MQQETRETLYTQNRELSWLRFNERVLLETQDASVPLVEKLRFVSIFTSNLDEFFMIRVGSLLDISLLDEEHADNKSGMTAREQLARVYQAVHPLYERRDGIFFSLEERLREHDVYNLTCQELEAGERKFLREYFDSYVAPVLSPQIMDAHHPFPHLESKSLNVGVRLETKEGKRFGLIPVPKSLPRLLYLPGGSVRYVRMEEIILENADRVFDRCEMVEKTVLSVTRNADLNPDDETFELEENFRLHMKKVLKKRARLAPVRLETRDKLSGEFLKYLLAQLDLSKEQAYVSHAPLEMSYVYGLEQKLSQPMRRALLYAPYKPLWPADLDGRESMFRQIQKRDVLLFNPYESIEPFLKLVREAASDPAVISIKITLYRIDKQSRLAETLIMAAENGRDVTVMMELRARFDEENNIEWAERLEAAGCRVLYGIDGIKAHSKICLITRREKNRLQYFTQVGTGNYNEKTAAIYSDFSLMTYSREIGMDAAAFFKNIAISNLDGQYAHLLVAPSGFKRGILALIQGEIDKALRGEESAIRIKINSITDRDVIDKLSEASRAGVPVEMIVRGICCIRPGIGGRTDNITVACLVGRFLEHARVYVFGAESEAVVYIASADLMTRNTERRVEIACPILDRSIKARVLETLNAQMADDQKARRMAPDGMYTPAPANPDGPFNAQESFMRAAEENHEPEGRTGVLTRIARRAAVLRNRFFD